MRQFDPSTDGLSVRLQHQAEPEPPAAPVDPPAEPPAPVEDTPAEPDPPAPVEDTPAEPGGVDHAG